MAVVGQATIEIKGNFSSLRNALAGSLYQYTTTWEQTGVLTADIAGIAFTDKSGAWAQKHGASGGDASSKALIARIQSGLQQMVSKANAVGATLGDDIGKGVETKINAMVENWENSDDYERMKKMATGEEERDVIFDPRPRGTRGDEDVDKSEADDHASRHSSRSGGGGSKPGDKFGKRLRTAFDKHMKDRKPAPFEDIIKNVADNFLEMMVKQALILQLVAAASSLVSALGAFGAGLAQGAAGFLPMGNIFAALMQGMLVGKALFGGIGKAIKAVSNVQKKAVKVATDAAKRGLRVARARLSLKQAILRNSRVMEDSVRKIDKAQRKYTKSLEKEEKARRKLDDAKQDAQERIEDMKFELEDAALSEERAMLNLKKAEKDLQRARAGTDVNAIYEADLAYREQELELRQIRESNIDLREESAEVFTKGVDNDENVLDGLKGIEEAARNAAAASQDLKRAQEDAPLEIERAMLAVEAALLALKRALEPPKDTAFKALTDAMADLSPAAQRFVYFWVGRVQPILKDMKKAGQEAFFPGLQRGVESLVNSDFFKYVNEMVVGTSGALGGFAESLLKAFAEPENVDTLKVIFDSNKGIIATFGRIVVVLLRPMLQIVETIAPFAEKMALRFEEMSNKFANFIDEASDSGGLTTFFGDTERRLLQLKDMFKAFGPGLGDVVAAALPAADTLITGITDMGKEWSKTFDEDKKENMKKVFLGSADNFLKILNLLADIVPIFFRFGGNKNVGTIADAIDKETPIIGDALISIFNQIDDDIVRIIDAMGLISRAMANSQAVQVFIKVVGWAIAIVGGIAGAVASFPPGAWLIGAITAYLGLKRFKDLAFGMAKFFFGGIKGTVEAVQTVVGFFKGGGKAGPGRDAVMSLTGALQVFSREQSNILNKKGNEIGVAATDALAAKMDANRHLVKENAVALGNDFVAALNMSLGISSPSTIVMKEVKDFAAEVSQQFYSGVQESENWAKTEANKAQNAYKNASHTSMNLADNAIEGMQTITITSGKQASSVGVASMFVHAAPGMNVALKNSTVAFGIGYDSRAPGAVAAGAAIGVAEAHGANDEGIKGGDKTGLGVIKTQVEVGKRAGPRYFRLGKATGLRIDRAGMVDGAAAIIDFLVAAWKDIAKGFTAIIASAFVAGEEMRRRIKRALAKGLKDVKLPKSVKDKITKINKNMGVINKAKRFLSRFVDNLIAAGKTKAGEALKKAIPKIFARAAVREGEALVAGAVAGGTVGTVVGPEGTVVGAGAGAAVFGTIMTVVNVVWTAWDFYQLIGMFWELWRTRDEWWNSEDSVSDEEVDAVIQGEDETTFIEEDYEKTFTNTEFSFISGGIVPNNVKQKVISTLSGSASRADKHDYVRAVNTPFFSKLEDTRKEFRQASQQDAILGPRRDPWTGDPQDSQRRKRRNKLKQIAATGALSGGVQRFAKGGMVKGKYRGRDTELALVTPGEYVLTPQMMANMQMDYFNMVIKKRRKRLPEGQNQTGVGFPMGGVTIPDWVMNPNAYWRDDALLNDINIKDIKDWLNAEIDRITKYFKEQPKYTQMIADHEDLFKTAITDAVTAQQTIRTEQETALKTALDIKRAEENFNRFGLPHAEIEGMIREILPPVTGEFAEANSYRMQSMSYDALGRLKHITGDEALVQQEFLGRVGMTAEFEDALFTAYKKAVAALIAQQLADAKAKADAEAANNPPAEPVPTPAGPATPTLPDEAPITDAQRAANLIGKVDSKTGETWRYPLRDKRFPGKNYAGHNPQYGVDISGSGIFGQPVVSIQKGRVIAAKDLTTSYGKYFKINHYDNTFSLYAHLSQRENISSGTTIVHAGQLLGKVGSTGNSTGAHLHFELYGGEFGTQPNATVDHMAMRGIANIGTRLRPSGAPAGGKGGYRSKIPPIQMLNIGGKKMFGYFLGKGISKRRGHSLNAGGLRIPLAEGGVIQATPGGIEVVIAEGGRDERITPLNYNLHSDAEEMVIYALKELVEEENDIFVTNNVHIPPRPTVKEIASRFSRELMYSKRRLV
jgi:murein DD-endopeptidase MepM/ murein hydrolase activator NlpD